MNNSYDFPRDKIFILVIARVECEVFGLSRVDEFAEADVANVGIWAGAATDEDIVFAKLGDEVVLGFGHRFWASICLGAAA